MKIIKILLIGFALVASAAMANNNAEIIYRNGTILTMNDAQPRAEAVAVSSGKILAVDSDDQIMKLKGNSTRVIDINGKTMIPGFVDAHGHVLMIGLQCQRASNYLAEESRDKIS